MARRDDQCEMAAEMTNVRGTGGPGSVGDAVLGTGWSGVSGSSNVRGPTK